MPDFPSIPVPTADPNALLQTALALKQTVEMLTGQDQTDRFTAHVFIQTTPPDAYHEGDLWLCNTTTNASFNVWNGSKWVKLTTVTGLTAETMDTLEEGDAGVTVNFRLREFLKEPRP